MSTSASPSASGNAPQAQSHVAVFLTADASYKQAVDTACKQAEERKAEFSAFYIESDRIKPSELEALKDAANYASSVGAHIDAIAGGDPVYLVSEYCKSHHIDLLVMNRPVSQTGLRRFSTPFAQKVAFRIPETQLLTVPGPMTIHMNHLDLGKNDLAGSTRQFLRVVLIVALTICLCLILDHFGVEDFVLAQIVILGVLLCSINTSSWIWALFSAAISVVLFIYLFAEPRYSIAFAEPKLTLVLLMTFVSSLVGGFIGNKIHSENLKAQRSGWGTQMLLDTLHALQKAESPQQIVNIIARKLADVTEKDVVFYLYVDEILEDPQLDPFNPNHAIDRQEVDDELLLAKTCLKERTATGSRTPIHPEANYMFFPWGSPTTMYGVIGIRLAQEYLDPLELMILDNICKEGALSYEVMLRNKELQDVLLKAESDSLRSNLLKALSHDIRTPLTSIIGNISTLQHGEKAFSEQEIREIWSRIRQDSLSMYNMVENLLTAARFDNSNVPVKAAPDLLNDVVEAGLKFPRTANESHPIAVQESEDFLMVSMDSSLIAQVISNMVLNAIDHTPDGTPITVSYYQDGADAVVEVADTGQGLSDPVKERVFDIFYTGEAPMYDSTHYLGLGLFLCREIILAHKGSIEVHDNKPNGCVFSFRLPLLKME